MIYKTILTIPVVLLVAACGGGGGGGGGDVSTTANFTTLRAFSDGAGVGRGITSDGTQAVFIAPDIAVTVEAANESANTLGSDVQLSDLPVVATLDTAVVREGAATINGIVANVTIVEDNGGEASLVYIEIPNVGDAVQAIGSAFGAAPNGTFIYNGVHVIADRYFGGAEDGVFTLSTDFANNTFTYSAATSNTSLSGNGVIDTIDGRFASNNLTSNAFGDTGTATMYGQLHGNSAQSVSGVFHTNESDPFYAGAFVGSR